MGLIQDLGGSPCCAGVSFSTCIFRVNHLALSNKCVSSLPNSKFLHRMKPIWMFLMYVAYFWLIFPFDASIYIYPDDNISFLFVAKIYLHSCFLRDKQQTVQRRWKRKAWQGCLASKHSKIRGPLRSSMFFWIFLSGSPDHLVYTKNSLGELQWK